MPLPGLIPGSGLFSGESESYPIIENSQYSLGYNTQNYSCTMPSGIVAGELLVACVFYQRTAGSYAISHTGWTAAVSYRSGSQGIVVLYKTAAGSDTLNITNGTSNQNYTGTSFRISNFTGSPEAQYNTGSSTTIDYPSITPSWGSKKTLFISHGGWITYIASNPGPPTNYTTVTWISQNMVVLYMDHLVCYRENSATTEDPASHSNGGDNLIYKTTTTAIRGT
jgi:hypothetical protein